MTELKVKTVTVSENLTEPTPLPKFTGATFGYAVEVYIPELQNAVHQCNGDKAAIRDLYGSESDGAGQ